MPSSATVRFVKPANLALSLPGLDPALLEPLHRLLRRVRHGLAGLGEVDGLQDHGEAGRGGADAADRPLVKQVGRQKVGVHHVGKGHLKSVLKTP